MRENYKLIESKKVYEGVIIDVVQDKITLPDGREAIREVVVHSGATAILPIDNDGKIILIKQYRHPVKKEVLEIPAGCIEADENPENCAIRELEEETSYKASKIEHLTSMYTAVGFCTEVIHIYLATGLSQGEFNFDDDEFITVERYTLDEVLSFIKSGKIIDAKTISAILLYKEKINA